MSLVYAIDEQQQCIFMHLSGVIEDWELGTAAQQLWAEPAFSPHFARYIVFSNTVELRTASSLISAIASDVRAKRPARVALVIQSETVPAEITFYAENLYGVPVRLFHSLEEANAWLSVHVPTPWPPASTQH